MYVNTSMNNISLNRKSNKKAIIKYNKMKILLLLKLKHLVVLKLPGSATANISCH